MRLPALPVTAFRAEEQGGEGAKPTNAKPLQDKNGKPLEGRLGGSSPDPGGGAPLPARHRTATRATLPSGTVTLLRCGFLVTSYPRFFRGTERAGPDLEWQPRADAEGVQRGTPPQAWPRRSACRAPVPSVAPMVLEQTWHRGETKVRGA